MIMMHELGMIGVGFGWSLKIDCRMIDLYKIFFHVLAFTIL